ncbi:MAG: hypothetical protein IJ112_08070 [Oscillospiraceae bacterium]|nr:hypothetical protein [Oscillospiraceae bacterium]
MNERYETKISDARWYAYDVPGNVGWIVYLVRVVQLLRQGLGLFAAVSVVPAVLMLVGIAELISERIAKLDRILPRKRLLLGFGALTLGGILGAVVAAIGLVTHQCGWLMLLGAVLCGVFAGLLYHGYQKTDA